MRHALVLLQAGSKLTSSVMVKCTWYGAVRLKTFIGSDINASEIAAPCEIGVDLQNAKHN
jgi:hypothetical protein